MHASDGIVVVLVADALKMIDVQKANTTPGGSLNSSGELNEIILRFGRIVAGSSIDRLIAESDLSLEYSAKSARRYVFDFAETIFINLGSSQYLIAFAAKCVWHGWEFRIVPSSSKRVRDFWNLWHFYPALERATGRDAADFFEDKWKFVVTERQTTFQQNSTATTYFQTDGIALRSVNFFGFHSIPLGKKATGMLAVSEADQWRTKEIKDILDRGLGIRSDYVSSRIVFEAIFNALKHPNAKLILTGSWHPRFYQRRDVVISGDQQGPFSLVFWDDGKSFSDVMQRALANGVKLRSEVDETFKVTYQVEFSDLSQGEDTVISVVDSFEEISNETPEEIRLLSTLFAGVSTSLLDDEPSTGDDTNRRGWGLFVLVDTVCNVLGGKVSFRTGRYFMQISKAGPRIKKERGADLVAKISKIQNNVPTFFGNMLSVDLSGGSKE